ncbi:chromate efflux transporter [Rehaibacterium terrae]|jgi:chromate transporter|uniref:Chromate transporter n=1 Tax=Rehaibacterium terrae TaxID=1341696 RepID=A0A7W7XYN4_9GAMM|nr:chromate efflux transporter [Rehaibacterium terrae]MBB5014859.1 chromate transporter [Rehaibacterium terrae]
MNPVSPTFAQALRFWWKLGWISFGGPAGQIALMHSELVERRRWVDEGAFLHGLNYCMLLPGPEAMQLATYLGWRLHGLRGGIAAGALFVLPGALLIALLSWLYVRYGTLPAVAGVLLGLQAAVLGIIAHAVARIGRRVLKTPFAFAVALAALFAVAVLSLPFPAIVVGAGLLGLAAGRWRRDWLPQDTAHAGLPPVPATQDARRGWALRVALACLLLWWLPLLALGGWLGAGSTAFAQALFFSKAALITFGGAYAVLPYVAQQAVQTQQWLTAEQMLVGLGLAETTPGPLILVLEFVGFVGGWQQPDFASPLAAALLGAAVTLWATFLPCFLFVLPAAPWIERLRDWPLASAALGGITAAVVGVIANLALWFGWHLFAANGIGRQALIATLALATLGALVRGRSVLWLVPACAAIGALAGVWLPGG